MTNETCHDHSGCVRDIHNLKADNLSQWSEINLMRNRIDGLLNRMNVILGGVVVSLILLALNLALKIV